MKEGEEKTSNYEHNQHEEEVNHDNICHFVGEVYTKEVLALPEEVEGELFYIPLVYYEEKNPIEWVFSDVLGNPVVKEEPEDEGKEEVSEEDSGKLVVEEVEVIGEEAQTLRIFVKGVNFSVLLFVFNTLQ